MNAAPLETAPYRIDGVTLVARDLDGLAGFYRDVVGLAVIEQVADRVRLGVGARVLLELRHRPDAVSWTAPEAGLFHTAFLLPSRGDLGAWLAHAAGRGLRLSGAADHLVSEAVYLTDPEGNGIEIYADRPVTTWERDDAGGFLMRNAPLDHAGLMHAAPGPWTGMPAGACIGHVHLQVGALEPAERFYAGPLGFDVTCRYPGATFFGAGGYHHQLAVNIWNSRDAPVRRQGTTGLAEITMVVEVAALANARDHAAPGGRSSETAAGALVLNDPWGTRFRLVPDRHSL